MSNAFNHENTPFGSYGEFDAYDQTADWSDEDWSAYDQQVADEIAAFDAAQDDYFIPEVPDSEVPF